MLHVCFPVSRVEEVTVSWAHPLTMIEDMFSAFSSAHRLHCCPCGGFSYIVYSQMEAPTCVAHVRSYRVCPFKRHEHIYP